MAATIVRGLAVGAVLGLALGTAPARAQITVEPQSVSVSVPQHEEATQTVTLTNKGEEPLAFCLSFGRPLEGGRAELYLSEESIGSACGTYGEVLAQVSQLDLGIGWDPYGITMTPDGRLFAADYADDRTHELTPELELVRSFEHPFMAGCYPFPAMTGVTYNADTGTLWWMNIDSGGLEVCSALLLEGDLDGSPTGRQIEVPVAEAAPPPYESGSPVGASYDAQTDRYYFIDFANDDIWAVDTLGSVIDGYPVVLQAYVGGQLGFGVDAHRGIEEGDGTDGGTKGLWLEVGVNRPGDSWITRVVAVDANGAWGGIETPVPVLDETGSRINGNPLRSRLDPNGAMYYAYSSFSRQGVVAVRPHPLPPSWLALNVWDGTLAPGESQSIALTFRPGGRAIGDYTASLQVFDAATGEAVEVPLTLEVVPGTDAEEEVTEPEAAALSVYPNPSFGEATAALSLSESADVRVALYDVLGRRVALLHAGWLEAGAHQFRFPVSALPAGLYVVRAEVGDDGFAERVTVLR